MSQKSTAKSRSTPFGIDQEKSTAGTEAPSLRVLPADVYDAFELSVLAYGIGRVLVFEPSIEGDVPCCILGHAEWLAGDYYGAAIDIINRHRPLTHENDVAVKRINEQKGVPINTRVSWGEYTRELNIVRGK